MHGMKQRVDDRLQNMQQQFRDPLLTVLTLLLVVLLFVVAPLDAAGVVVFQGFGFIVALVMFGCALVVSASSMALSALLVAFCMNAAAAILRILHGHSSLDIYLVAGAWFILAVTLGWVVARGVFAAGRVNYHRVVGAVLLYLLIGLLFVSLFVFIGALIPKPFSGVAVEDNNALASNLIYFSFVTLTSTGYGDIAPLHPIARSLCNLETIIGQLYPATLLARLVTLEIESHRQG
jgi:Ion channel